MLSVTQRARSQACSDPSAPYAAAASAARSAAATARCLVIAAAPSAITAVASTSTAHRAPAAQSVAEPRSPCRIDGSRFRGFRFRYSEGLTVHPHAGEQFTERRGRDVHGDQVA